MGETKARNLESPHPSDGFIRQASYAFWFDEPDSIIDGKVGCMDCLAERQIGRHRDTFSF
jgi:hypothetical protein